MCYGFCVLDFEISLTVAMFGYIRSIAIIFSKACPANPEVRLAVSPSTEQDSPKLLFADDYSNIFRLLMQEVRMQNTGDRMHSEFCLLYSVF